MVIVNEVYQSIVYSPDAERYGLQSQVTRSTVSIPSNIAEGSAKKSQKEYRCFAAISLGSAFELETQLLIVEQLGWVPKEKVTNLLALTIEEQKMLSVFINKLLK